MRFRQTVPMVFCRKDRFVSQDEKIYWQAYNQTIDNNRQKAEAAPANEAIYFLGGPAGAAIRSALAVKGTEELINAVDDASKGEYKEALKGAGLGGLDLLGARAPAGQGLASRGTSSGRSATDISMKIENSSNTEIRVVLDKKIRTALPRVEAELSFKDGVIFRDTNQGNRPDFHLGGKSYDTLIKNRILEKENKSGKPLPNKNMATAHAEVGAIQQAFEAGKTEGNSMELIVTGEPICGYCTGDIAAMANLSGLKYLLIKEEYTGTVFSGMKV